MTIALSILAAYLDIALVVAVLARRVGLPWWLCALAGIAWLPELIGILIDVRRKTK